MTGPVHRLMGAPSSPQGSRGGEGAEAGDGGGEGGGERVDVGRRGRPAQADAQRAVGVDPHRLEDRRRLERLRRARAARVGGDPRQVEAKDHAHGAWTCSPSRIGIPDGPHSSTNNSAIIALTVSEISSAGADRANAPAARSSSPIPSSALWMMLVELTGRAAYT